MPPAKKAAPAKPAAKRSGEGEPLEGPPAAEPEHESAPDPRDPVDEVKGPDVLVVLTAFHAATTDGGEVYYRAGTMFRADSPTAKKHGEFMSGPVPVVRDGDPVED